MNWGEPIAQLVSLDGLEATALVPLWPGDFLDLGELKWLAPLDVGFMRKTLDYFFP